MPHDNGAAPNPFGGTCTLAICKPVIRRTAKVEDWVVGTGSAHFGFENKVIYAMKITETLTMREYDKRCNQNLKIKIPDFRNAKSYRDRVGDCIYDFSTDPPVMRMGVHNEGNRQRDLDGLNVLLSKHFYYFGENALELPEYLRNIIRKGQGHRSTSNAQYFELFVTWIESKTEARNKILSEPMGRESFTRDKDHLSKCAAIDNQQDELDEKTPCD